MRKLFLFLLLVPFILNAQRYDKENWEFLSTVNGDFEIPNPGNQQTSCFVVDIDNNGIKEIFITERSTAPSVVMYKFENNKWERYIIDNEPLRIEASGGAWDITGNGYMDISFAGDSRSNQVWWWENPYPNFDKNTPWKRRYIKNSGSNKHHDHIFGDFTGDGKGGLAFWNQGADALMFAEIPKNVKDVKEWNYRPIHQYQRDSQMEQIGHGKYPGWKTVNDSEGLYAIDIDGDGIDDVVGGGYWFKHMGNGEFQAHIIDASYTFTRAIAGQFIEGGRPEVVLVASEAVAPGVPIMLYEWRDGTWFGKELPFDVEGVHSFEALDFNGNGHLDIFVAEMRLSGRNPYSRMRILLGDGRGNFEEYRIATGFGYHESRIADLNGNGLYDIVGKPYNWEAPRLDIWMNKGIFK